MEEEAILQDEEAEWWNPRYIVSTNIRSLVSSRFSALDLSSNSVGVRQLWRPVKYPELRPLLPPTADLLLRRGSPILLTVHDKFCTFFDPIYDVVHHIPIPKLVGARLQAAIHEWLLLTRPAQKIFFYNLLTGIEVPLPDYWEGFCQQACILAPPDSPDCLVVCLSLRMEKVSIIRCGETRWTTYEYRKSLVAPTCNPILYKHKLFILDRKGQVIEMDYENPGRPYGFIKRPKPMKKWRHRYIDEGFLIEKDGELLGFFVETNERRINLFALDTRTTARAWRGVESLEDEMLFVSKGSSILEEAVVRGTENKVYVAKTQDDHGMFYSLATKRFHTFFDDCSRKGSQIVKYPKPSCAWVRVRPAIPR